MKPNDRIREMEAAFDSLRDDIYDAAHRLRTQREAREAPATKQEARSQKRREDDTASFKRRSP